MRAINYIVIHCTAGSAHQSTQEIREHWSKLGWKNPGYHYLINADGSIEELAQEASITNGVKGYNANSIHMSYKGGVSGGRPKDTRTQAQKEAMEGLVRDLHIRYPFAKILGHRDFPLVNKACPSFDVAEWLEEIKL
jgi:N-acetylmuramoyl-L-alanine amidase